MEQVSRRVWERAGGRPGLRGHAVSAGTTPLRGAQGQPQATYKQVSRAVPPNQSRTLTRLYFSHVMNEFYPKKNSPDIETFKTWSSPAGCTKAGDGRDLGTELHSVGRGAGAGGGPDSSSGTTGSLPTCSKGTRPHRTLTSPPAMARVGWAGGCPGDCQGVRLTLGPGLGPSSRPRQPAPRLRPSGHWLQVLPADGLTRGRTQRGHFSTRNSVQAPPTLSLVFLICKRAWLQFS